MLEAIPSEIVEVKTMAKSLRITVDTQETLTPESMAKLFTLKDKVGWFFFAEHAEKLPDTIETAELPDLQLDEMAGEKSPSQRLRAVLFIYWKQKDSKDDFELFYRRWMERAIENIKQKLI